jgi:hypothetical protein
MRPATPKEIALAALAALVASLAAIAYFGLSPFDFDPENRIEWIPVVAAASDASGGTISADPGTGGLRFRGEAIAYSDGTLMWPAGAGALSIEVWLKPSAEPHTHLARILALYDEEELPVLSIDQWLSALIIRDRFTTTQGEMTYREHGLLKQLEKGKAHYLALTSDAAGTSVYLDGEPVPMDSKAPIISAGERVGGQLVLGNGARGNQEWQGELYSVALYSRLLSSQEIAEHARGATVSELWRRGNLLALYTLNEGVGDVAQDSSAVDTRGFTAAAPSIRVPAEFQPLRRTILHWTRANERSYGWYVQDLALNIAGFVPTGFLLAYLMRRRGHRGTALLLISAACFGGAVSLGIELTQVWIPSRVSSLNDLSANILGAFVGCLLENLLEARRDAAQS